MEHRALTGEVSLNEEENKISGYAAVFYRADDPGTEYAITDELVERIERGAFDDAVTRDDVRGMYNHSQVIGRTKSGTMTLSVDEKGLRYEITPPNTELGRSLVESIKRGDVDGSSFGFLPRGDDGAVVKRKDGRYIRSIKSVELFDVGPVDFPAYKGTSTFARSLDAAKAELE